MKSARLPVQLVLVALLAAGCLPRSNADEPASSTTVPTTPDTAPVPGPDNTGPTPDTSAPAPTPGTAPKPNPTPTTAAGRREAGVIKGVVRDEQGDPVPGARIRIVGYTGNPTGLTGADHDEDLVTDAAGAYRVATTAGLYEITGEADLTFEGQKYVFWLHPADGVCQDDVSSAGLVKDFVLRLSGFQKCNGDAPDPDNAGFYSGGSIEVHHEAPKSLPGDTQLTFTLTPTGALAHGGSGKALTFTRSVAALGNTSLTGALETRNVLHDIPLARYQISGHATLPGGARQNLGFGSFWAPKSAPAASYTVGFEAVKMYPYGIRAAVVSVYEAGGGTPAPTPTTTPPATTAPTSPSPSTSTTICGEYWGCM